MYDREECKHTTKDFVKLGLDVETIIGSAYPSFIFDGRNYYFKATSPNENVAF